MAHYVIGDVQGCLDPLLRLLERIHYQPQNDQLIFAGDIINRGPKSLETLRFIHELPNVVVTLGNHDLYFLALACQAVTYLGQHTLDTLLTADDCQILSQWLSRQPILYCHEPSKTIVTHAGILPTWSIAEAKTYAKELEAAIQGEHAQQYFQHMAGDNPARWDPELQGYERLRFITNAFTRMRFTNAQGHLELKTKSATESPYAGYKKWFTWPRDLEGYSLCFGHFAAIFGNCSQKNIYALDTGCVWGHQLTACRLEDRQLFHEPA